MRLKIVQKSARSYYINCLPAVVKPAGRWCNSKPPVIETATECEFKVTKDGKRVYNW